MLFLHSIFTQAEKILGNKIGQLSSEKVIQVGWGTNMLSTFRDTFLLATVDGSYDQKTLKLADCVGEYSRSHLWHHNRSCGPAVYILSAASNYQDVVVCVCGTKREICFVCIQF